MPTHDLSLTLHPQRERHSNSQISLFPSIFNLKQKHTKALQKVKKHQTAPGQVIPGRPQQMLVNLFANLPTWTFSTAVGVSEDNCIRATVRYPGKLCLILSE